MTIKLCIYTILDRDIYLESNTKYHYPNAQ